MTVTKEAFSADVATVPLPAWAADLGVGSPPAITVHACCLGEGDEEPYLRCDWWQAACYYLAGAAEHAHEAVHGPIHSYAARLDVDERIFDHAWVNRIMLFLRRWAARMEDREETDLFGPLPDAAIDLTHDVDAVSKTPEIRFKQAAFHGINAGRALLRGRPGQAAAKVISAARFLTSEGDYWRFPEIRALEEKFGIRSTFHFYGGPPGNRRGWRARLFDPAYEIGDRRLAGELKTLRQGGWRVGLHPSYGSWKDASQIRKERETLEAAVGAPVERCRQHWLRFSWTHTWKAQEDAGLAMDSTLGFNERPGFRNSAALVFNPVDIETGAMMAIRCVPMILMDSHLYDYRPLTDAERGDEISRWVNEVKAVHGVASVVWHQRVLAPDYGWGNGFLQLLEAVGPMAVRELQ